MDQIDAEWVAELERLQADLAALEPNLAPALEAFNAAVTTAYDTLLQTMSTSEGCERQAQSLRYRVESELQDAADDQPTPQAKAWLKAWRAGWAAYDGIHLVRPPRLKVPQPRLSTVLAGLPRRPQDVAQPPSIRPVGPATLATVADSWRRIDAWLATDAPRMAPQMPAG